MARISQGENFEEAPIVDASGNIVQPSEQEAANAPTPPKFGPKQIAIGAAIAVVVVVGGIILLSGGNGDTPAEDTTVSDTTSDGQKFDEDGFLIIDDGFAPDDFDVVDDGFEPDDFDVVDDGSSTPSTDSGSSAPSGSASDNRTAVSNPYAYISYTESEVATLRANGYTGDEIEYAAQQGISMDEMLSNANSAREKANKEWMDTILDEASPGYQELLESTFLGLPKTPSTTEGREVVYIESKKENVDYEKIGVYNYQAWVKLHLSFGDVFYLMPLDRYDDLPDTGNIVISYSVRSDADHNIVDISGVSEVII